MTRLPPLPPLDPDGERVLYLPMQPSMEISAERARRMPAAPVRDGFDLRGCRPGDEESWIELINTGGFGIPWDRAKLDEYLEGAERREGSRLAVSRADGRILAATFASREEPDGGGDAVGRLDFVVAHPEVRGTGLGRAVCSAVVRWLIDERGYESVILYTDDWRLPAIGLYLSMGFEPRLNRPDMVGRWAAARAKLAEGGR